MGNNTLFENAKTRNLGLLILRAGVGILFFVFGWQKIAGGEQVWNGVGSAMQFVGISAWPVFWGLMATLAEFAGGLLLALGLFTRPAAAFLAFTMIMATILKGATGTGIIDWYAPFTMLLIMTFFILNGGGVYSIDSVLRAKKHSGNLAA
ncbi:DoxX family protein [Chitinophaga sp. GCM10012297]|uniref:DoxX family protein n=1 Tax=Chitinophaga chungangae TaxID=2821488 RepID=A0ABS3YE07_9BACT|nr:DoxX family protein [Chitinophaga chungangae]MBO9152921.1 DoxX family protein [Chitinophaga chungangae]